jgi:hypothetical protein
VSAGSLAEKRSNQLPPRFRGNLSDRERGGFFARPGKQAKMLLVDRFDVMVILKSPSRPAAPTGTIPRSASS